MELPEGKEGICIGMGIPDQRSLQKTQKDVVTLGPEQQASGAPGKFFKEGQGDSVYGALQGAAVGTRGIHGLDTGTLPFRSC